MSEPLKEFNAFLSQARQAGVLNATLVRAGGPSHVESFLRKLCSVLSRAASKTNVTVNTVNREGLDKGAHAEHVHDVMALGWPVSDNLTKFAALHDVGQHAFNVLLAAGPGKGGGLAGAALVMAKGISSELAWSADSVFSKSFADCYAVLLCSEIEGPEKALAMAEDAYSARAASGDFNRFSTYANSCDTQDALQFVLEDLRSKIAAPVDSARLHGRALDLAAQGAGAWMHRHGVSRDRALALSEFVRNVSEVFASHANVSGAIPRPRC